MIRAVFLMLQQIAQPHLLPLMDNANHTALILFIAALALMLVVRTAILIAMDALRVPAVMDATPTMQNAIRRH